MQLEETRQIFIQPTHTSKSFHSTFTNWTHNTYEHLTYYLIINSGSRCPGVASLARCLLKTSLRKISKSKVNFHFAPTYICTFKSFKLSSAIQLSAIARYRKVEFSLSLLHIKCLRIPHCSYLAIQSFMQRSNSHAHPRLYCANATRENNGLHILCSSQKKSVARN